MARRHKRKKRGRSGPSRARPGPAKKTRLRWRWFLVLGLLVGAFGLYTYDRSGLMETIPAQVVELRTYPHTPRGGQTHTDTDAVVEYEGSRHTLKKADGLAKGKWVEINVRRGRLSGWAHYESFRGAADFDLIQSGAASPKPWEYDVILNKHWDPVHQHWHDGPPPAQGR